LEPKPRLNGGNTAAKPVAPRPTTIREGISRPVWIDDKLLFAHRVQRGDNTVIQGCWLDWAGLRSELLSEVADLLPGADLVAAPPGERWHVLATLPVQLTVPVPPLPDSGWSPIRLALAAVWGCLAMAALACAWLLAGVVALSERRASFVSAVTHELRTPLTTFRMYAEMLAGDMVPSPEQRKKYLETLCVEADRLTHLVDNVLLYARLERCKPGKNRTTVTASQLVDRFDSRLSDRAAQADMQLQLHVSDEVNQVTLSTDPGAVEQIIFNLVDNACKYASPTDDRRIVLSVEPAGAQLNLSVRDFGPGLSKAARRRLFEPFSKSSEEAAVTAPGVGLGLALCRRLATELGGRLTLREASPGAEFVLSLPRGSSA
jgi:signal transduction histidine kinase